MRLWLLIALLLPFSAKASFLFNYGLNYSSEEDSSDDGDYEKRRTFHKAFLGASVNGARTLYFGWNLNSWNSAVSQGTANEDTYSVTEMGPRVVWFTNENLNLFFSAEWNPYAKGEREKGGESRDIQGQSMGVGMGYRFRLSRNFGLGASLHYHTLSIKEEKIGSTEEDVSDKVSNIMPMLEFTIIIK